ncbi:MAG: response regulator [bacterium]
MPKGYKVLVVDDDALVRDSMKYLLSEDDYQVTVAGSGTEALELIDKDSYDVILTDLRMPDMSGIELLRRIRGKKCKTPVAILTAYGTVEAVVEALQNGAYNFITKPLEIKEIRKVVAKGVKSNIAIVGSQRVIPFGSVELSFKFPSDPTLVGGVIYHIINNVEAFGYEVSNIRLSLDEAITNAIEHGNKLDPQKTVGVRCGIDGERFWARVEDEGDGFRWREIPDPRSMEALFEKRGRGIFLMRYYMDEINFNDKGNVVTMIKYRSSPKDSAGSP